MFHWVCKLNNLPPIVDLILSAPLLFRVNIALLSVVAFGKCKLKSALRWLS